jgi:hypothetical protein
MRDDDYEPIRRRPPPDNSSRTALKVILVVLGTILLLGACIGASVIGLAIYGVRQAGKAFSGTMAQFENDMKYNHVGAALSMYHAGHGEFPSPNMPTRSGKPGLSWRVAILPELGYQDLYKRFKLDEPWDHPDNLKLADEMPQPFLPPGAAAGKKTHMRVFVGGGAMFDYGKHAKMQGGPGDIVITDGLNDTIAFVEATQPVLWIQPDELPFGPGLPLPALGQAGNDWFYAVTADGVSHHVNKNIKPRNLQAAITAAGGESIGLQGP